MHNPADEERRGSECELDTDSDLPKDITVFGMYDPTVRKATVIVNGDMITDTDVDQRLCARAAGQFGRGDLRRGNATGCGCRRRRNLIDETLQIEEAKADEVTVGQDEIETAFARAGIEL